MKTLTIKDIAALSGVGISTVSRVLNNRPDVSEETRKRVMDIVSAHDYTPNNNAKNLKQRNVDLVSIIVRGRQNSFLNDIAERIIHSGNEQQGFLVDYIDEGDDEFATARRHVNEKKVRGVIFLGSNIGGRREEIRSLRIPCVFATVDASELALPNISSVSVDNRAGARMAVTHLLSSGHRRIAVFGGIRDAQDSIGQRYQGVLQALDLYRVPMDDSLYVECSFQMEKAYITASRFLAKKPDFTAIFAMGDTMAIGILRALADVGLRVPGDVSLVGFDGIPLSRFTLPRLATVAQPAEALAEKSVALMLRLLDDARDSEHVTVESMLITGESVGKLR